MPYRIRHWAAVVTVAVALPAVAETYGDEASSPDTQQAPRIKTVSRNAAAAATPAPVSAASPAAISAIASPATSPAEAEHSAWHLVAGHLVRQDLTVWGDLAGWKVIWQMPRDWTIPTDTHFDGDFKSAASSVISTLAENGIVIRARFFDGNRTMVVSGAGPAIPDQQ